MSIIGLMMRLIHSLLTLAAEPSGPWEGAAVQPQGWAGGKGCAGCSRPNLGPYVEMRNRFVCSCCTFGKDTAAGVVPAFTLFQKNNNNNK